MTNELSEIILQLNEGSLKNDQALFELCKTITEEIIKVQSSVVTLQEMMRHMLIRNEVMERRLDSLLHMVMSNAVMTDE